MTTKTCKDCGNHYCCDYAYNECVFCMKAHIAQLEQREVELVNTLDEFNRLSQHVSQYTGSPFEKKVRAVLDNQPAPTDEPTLAERLQAAGANGSTERKPSMRSKEKRPNLEPAPTDEQIRRVLQDWKDEGGTLCQWGIDMLARRLGVLFLKGGRYG